MIRSPRPPCVVIDTNLILSALVFAQGRLATLRHLWQSERCQPLVSKVTPNIYSKDLIEVIFRHPYTKIQFLVDANIAKRQTSSMYLQVLASDNLGILREHKVGREKYYINDALLQELTH